MGTDTRTNLARQLGRLAVFMLVLLGALLVAHYAVHVYVVLPALERGTPPAWTVAALYVPELVVAFAAGWRLRSVRAILAYAAAATVLRSAFRVSLALLGERGHASAGDIRSSEFAVAAPAVVLAYIAVLAVASWSGRADRRLVL